MMRSEVERRSLSCQSSGSNPISLATASGSCTDFMYSACRMARNSASRCWASAGVFGTQIIGQCAQVLGQFFRGHLQQSLGRFILYLDRAAALAGQLGAIGLAPTLAVTDAHELQHHLGVGVGLVRDHGDGPGLMEGNSVLHLLQELSVDAFRVCPALCLPGVESLSRDANGATRGLDEPAALQQVNKRLFAFLREQWFPTTLLLSFRLVRLVRRCSVGGPALAHGLASWQAFA